MNEFLRQVARCYYDELGKEVGECCFVFPNRRSALFFRKYLGQCAGKPLIAPHLMSINDLFSKLSGLGTVGKIPALDMLWRRYSALMWPDREPRESFDEFVFWGDTLLNDFDDIDKYMVDARGLFTNIDDLSRIDSAYSYLSEEQKEAIRTFWGNFLANGAVAPEEARLDKKGEFTTVWTILYPLYEGFRNDLREKGLAYEGMIYREVAESSAPLDPLKGYRRIVFVGLNALNECEKRLLNRLKKECETDFYWDFYGDRLTDPKNKSSMFLPSNIADYPSRHKIDPALAASQEFRSIAVPSAVGQTRLTAELLEDLVAGQGRVAEETAVILPDENLLMPMLGAIPESIQDVNVTMGFPLSASNVATFLRMLDRLHRNCRIKNGEYQFYHKDVIALLTHPFIRRALEGSGDGTKIADSLTASIRKNNIVYSPEADFAAHEALSAIFRGVEGAAGLPDYLHKAIAILQENQEKIDREFLYNLDKCVTSLANYGLEVKPATFFRLLGRLAEVIKVQFSGEPLRGLQIMGPLETRALDFKNVIILSSNEGTFPKRSVSASFIPYNLRRGFGLPTYEFQDAISAYHFYRSICRAENVTFIYDSRMEGLNSGEVSRYVKQLKYLYGVPIKEETASYVMGDGDSAMGPVPVEKTPEVMAHLEELFLRGDGRFSATSLNNYLDCRLKFYYGNVLGISEADEVSEGLDAGMFGSVFHKSMEVIYKPCEGRLLTPEDVRALGETDLVPIVDEAFRTECRIREVTGRNLIVRDLIIRFIRAVLEVDAAYAPFTFVKAEEGRSFRLKLDREREVTIFGKIDRVDSKGGQTRIVDYKTGAVKGKVVSKELKDMFARDKERPYIGFQLYLYALLVLGGEVSARCSNYTTAVYALRDIFEGAPAGIACTEEDMVKFRQELVDLISEILDPAVPFSPREDDFSQTCGYCNFNKLCNRWSDSK
ncbi:MAG: PD-(D/E)XK nuclease family protein [Bacteroidales bacterium]|nr:PD-(D/E)XK nuclease family protein [Bacteroidales bacterium]